jgi:hypothetical protein
MWIVRGKRMLPVMPFANGFTPWHSSQYAALPEIYAQDASLEIAWSSIALEQNTIAGEAIIPFISQGPQGCHNTELGHGRFHLKKADPWSENGGRRSLLAGDQPTPLST